jgi:hypothetical protein
MRSVKLSKRRSRMCRTVKTRFDVEVPGTTISYNTLCRMSSAQQDEIRQAFNEAFM